ncbi:MAG: 50S ribosomal protein L10 [Caldisericia bacterium]
MLTRKEKETAVKEIREIWDASKGMIVIDSQKLEAAAISELRRQCREAGVKLRVFKNTLVKLALKDLEINGIEKQLKGPTATAFAMEEMPAAAKVFSEFKKDYPKKLIIKGGVMEGKVFDEEGVKQLASIPPREVLLGMVANAFNAPIVKFARVLQANITGIARVLDAVREKKEKAA